MQLKNDFRLTSVHVRGARAILKWTLEDVAGRAKVTKQTVFRLENDLHVSREDTRQRVRRVFEEAGIVFTNGNEPGVKLRQLNNDDKH